MPEAHTELYVHLVWSTWDRLPLLDEDTRQRIYKLFISECKKLNAEVLAIGGMSDHIHVLIRIPPTISVSELVKQLKGSSSHFANHTGGKLGEFKWQGGYCAVSVSMSLIPAVRAYISMQEEHHREGTVKARYEVHR